MFLTHDTDKHPIVILNGIRFEELQSVIKFMYNGEIQVQESELEYLLAAAELLQVTIIITPINNISNLFF